MRRTKAQLEMELAYNCVKDVKAAAEADAQIAQIYGGLCHKFPVMVRTCGLCQSLAFSVAKGGANKSGREKAHTLLVNHVGRVLNLQSASPSEVLEAIQGKEMVGYMLDTKAVLSCWIYFKRFGESVLGVSDASGEDGNT